jgi:endonuclease YncB( thermonuclease family)
MPSAKRHHLDKYADTLVAANTARDDDDELLDTREVAKWLRVSYQWLTIGRCKEYGPKYVRISNRRVMYRRGDVLRWLRSRTYSSTSQYLIIIACVVLALLSPLPVSAKTIVLVDGDTIRIDNIKIRIVNIDTPETYRSRCERELILGLRAKERLRELLDSGDVTYKATGTDRYGRTLAHVHVDGANVGEQLISEGHALRWRPGAQAKAQRLALWCDR